MIENDNQFDQANEALMRLERGVRALRVRVYKQNPALFAAMAEDYRVNIANIRGEIDEYLGIAILAGREIPLWMVLEGQEMSGRDVSSRLLSDWLDRFRKALYGVTAYIEKGIVRAGGSPDAAILAATDPHVVALASGSIRVALRLPDVAGPQGELFESPDEETRPPYRALDALFGVAEWAASGKTELPPHGRSDVARLTVAARFAAELAPGSKGAVRTVTFSGPLVPSSETLRLTADSRTRLQGLVQLLSKTAVESIHGQIREIDLDKQRITLRERGPGTSDLRCTLTADLMRKAESLLDKRVVVRGEISSATPDTMRAQTIDLDE